MSENVVMFICIVGIFFSGLYIVLQADTNEEKLYKSVEEYQDNLIKECEKELVRNKKCIIVFDTKVVNIDQKDIKGDSNE